jgi:hypothetical protein
LLKRAHPIGARHSHRAAEVSSPALVGNAVVGTPDDVRWRRIPALPVRAADVKALLVLVAPVRRCWSRWSARSEARTNDNVFRLAFSEDFIEHLDQVDSVTFLAEVHRTLKAGGVLRISSPSLEGVMQKHYARTDFAALMEAKREAYDMWGHKQFYSRESLRTVARQIGFDISFSEFGVSVHPELSGLDTRINQSELNLFAELTKRG